MIPWRIAAAAVCLSACTVVPRNAGTADVRFDKVVKRVKCDLLGAIYTKANQDPDRFGFLTQWSAKVHMTLTVDDQGSVNPGLTVTSPLAVSGTTFSVGAGASLTGQAQRIEDYEFFLSFDKAGSEMTQEVVRARYDGCRFPDGVLLESDFDFGSVIERAVSPIEAGLLKKGRQVGPGSNTSPSIPANEIPNIKQALNAARSSPIIHPNVADLVKSDARLGPLFDKLSQGKTIQNLPTDSDAAERVKAKKAQDAADAIANSPKVAQNVHEVIENVVKPLYDLAVTTNLPSKCNIQMQRDRAAALSSAAAVSISKSNIDNATSDEADLIIESYKEEKDAREKVLLKAQAMLEDITNCKEPLPPPPTPVVTLYDPIDLIQETVNFYITASGSVTPAWKLVRVSAPLSSPFLSATAKTANSMIITMGRPNTANGKQEASQAMQTSLSAALIGQSINQRLIP
ncbi:hypothetical protein [Bradyrhizobium sp. SZCCHNG3015]|uniref:hypothetical protein n=1 Tax=Bradyrhizobium sp. SZCCHNG3015 TaxID=3057270 RepID=UPI0028E490EF|nr:hypothetical protein [Bradyrhizobium sp. SZCCHNG3015]